MSDSESDVEKGETQADIKGLKGFQRLRTNARQVVHHYEEDLRNDLAVHLYSAHLLHMINPNFPQEWWASWPLARDKVPNPNTLKKYIDEGRLVPNDNPVSEIIGNIKRNNMKKKILAQENDNDSDGLGEDQDQGFNNEEENDAENHDEEQHREDEEVISDDDAEEQLDQEINSLFQKKLHQNYVQDTKNRIRYPTEFNLDNPNMPEHHLNSIKDKLDNTLNKFPAKQGQIAARSMYDWKDIFLQSGIKDPKLYNKLEKLFVTDANKFIKEHEESQNVEAGEEEDSSDEDGSESNDDDDSHHKGKEDQKEETEEDPKKKASAARRAVLNRSRANFLKKRNAHRQVRDILLQEMLKEQ